MGSLLVWSHCFILLFICYGVAQGIGHAFVYLPAVTCCSFFFKKRKSLATSLGFTGFVNVKKERNLGGRMKTSVFSINTQSRFSSVILDKCSGTIAPCSQSQHLTVSMHLCSSESNKLRALEGRNDNPKSLARVRDQH